MAIDTKAKRFAMLNFLSADDLLFDADSSVDADDRAHLLTLYGGNALAGAPTAVLIAQARSVARFVAGRVFGRVN